MGFWRNLFSGGRGFAAATNALLAEHMLVGLQPSQRGELLGALVEVFRCAGFPNLDAATVFRKFDAATRLEQLNLLAMAMQELGWQPSIRGEMWHPVRNPFLEIPPEDIEAVASRVESQRGVRIPIPKDPIRTRHWRVLRDEFVPDEPEAVPLGPFVRWHLRYNSELTPFLGHFYLHKPDALAGLMSGHIEGEIVQHKKHLLGRYMDLHAAYENDLLPLVRAEGTLDKCHEEITYSCLQLFAKLVVLRAYLSRSGPSDAPTPIEAPPL